MSFKDIIKAKQAAALAEVGLAPEAITESPTVEKASEEKVSPFLERIRARQAAAALAQSSPAPAPTELEVPAEKATVESYWFKKHTGEFTASLDGKPKGFGWQSVTLEFYNSLIAENLPSPTEQAELAAPKTPLAKAVEGQFLDISSTLATMRQAYLAARFTVEEAEEELELVKAMLEEDPSLCLTLAESPVPLNAGQLRAVDFTKKGQSFVLTGAAGTGKTTAQAAVVDILDKEGAFSVHDFKYLGEAPSIAICAFTKVAVRNIQKAIRKNPRIAHYADHCMTIHALLEYEPEKVERVDENGGRTEVKMFMPQRNASNKLGITHLVIEEASMVGLDLWWKLFDALDGHVQIIYLGDINQLQPVFSKPILGYALVKLPVIELSRVYRQALDSPIIYNAHQVLKGHPIVTSQCGKVSVIVGKDKTKVGQSRMGLALGSQFRKMWEAGFYSPESDMILLPWNKQYMGTHAINEIIASFLGVARDALVYHVKANRTQWYLAVDDKVMVDKRIGVITNITVNPKYIGPATNPAGFYTRDGTPVLGGGSTVDFDATGDGEEVDYATFSMEDVEVEEGKRASSHIVTVRWEDSPNGTDSTELRTSGDFGAEYFSFGYAMTVHKAQGSEWRKVFYAQHADHLSFVSRELMYTALTRAREEFIAFSKEDVMIRACLRQEIKGTSLQDKIEYFNSGALADLDTVPVEKLDDEEIQNEYK